MAEKPSDVKININNINMLSLNNDIISRKSDAREEICG
jgi:hypothetical protein